MYRVFDDVFVWYKVEVCPEPKSWINLKCSQVSFFLPTLAIYYILPCEEDCSVTKLQNNSPVQLTVSCSQFIHHAVVYGCSHQNCPRPLFTLSKSVLINSKGLSSSDFIETFLLPIWIDNQRENREIQIKDQRGNFKAILKPNVKPASSLTLVDLKLKA